MSQNDVAEFMGQNHGQGRFIRKYVKQSATHDNRVADGKRLKRGGQQYAAVNISRQVNVIGDEQIVHHGTENFVYIAGGSE